MKSLKNNKPNTKDNILKQKTYLVNKISSAIKMKYNNVFQNINYQDKELKEDIDKLITTQYYSWHPKDVFKPIESDILNIVKTKNPKVKMVVKKPRKIPNELPLIDKYQENKELLDKHRSKTQKHNRNLSNKINTELVNKKQSNKMIEKVNEETSLKINETDINKNKIESNNNNNTVDYIEEPRELLEKLNTKIKYDANAKRIKEDLELYKKELELKKEAKNKKKIELDNYLKNQIEEKNNKKKEEINNKIKEKNDIENYIKSVKEEELNAKKNKYIKMNNVYNEINKYNSLKKQQEEKNKKQQEEYEKKLLSEQENEKLSYEQLSYLSRREKLKNELLKEFEDKQKKKQLTISNKQPLSTTDIDSNNTNTSKPYSMLTTEFGDNHIKDKVMQRVKDQEAAISYLQKIYDSKNKGNSNKYIIEKERQDEKTKLECEIADQNRQNKINEMKKALDECINNKKIKKEEKLKENLLIRESNIKEYENYLKEENERKLKKIKSYENYRKALEEQIKYNKLRDINEIQKI